MLGFSTNTLSAEMEVDSQGVRNIDGAEFLPFVGDSITNNKIVELTFNSISYGHNGNCASMRSCKTWLDWETGRFLQAKFTLSDYAGAESRTPSASYWERKLANSKYKFEGFPTEEPAISIVQAIMETFTLSSPCSATETMVWYLMLSRFDGKPFPALCIMDRNVPFNDIREGLDRELPGGGLTNYLTIVDARTGKTLIIMTID
jgi:hypothetical protein